MTTTTTTTAGCPWCGQALPERRRSGDRYCSHGHYQADAVASLDERATRLRQQADGLHDEAEALEARAARLRLRVTAGQR